MTIAIRTDTLLAPGFTQLTLYNAVKTALNNSGYTALFDEFVSGTDRIAVYSIVLDSTKAFGTTYLRVRVTATFVIAQQLFATWNPATDTGTGGSTEIVYTALVTNAQINFTSLNGGSEYGFSVFNQGVAVLVLGAIAPINKPLWWDLNAWNYSFLPTTPTFSIFRSTTQNPYGNAENDTTLNTPRMSTANMQTNRRDLLPGIIFYNQSAQGISGRSSDDLVMVAAAGTTRYDTVQIPNDPKQYLILNPAAGGLAVRVS